MSSVLLIDFSRFFMPTYRLHVTLNAPLAVSESRDTAGRSSIPDVVPPRTLRGALAAQVQRHGADKEVMNALFGPEGCRTTALMPSSPVRDASTTVTPVPLTLRTCKYKSGFQHEGKHGVEDVLFAALHLAVHDDSQALASLGGCSYPECQHVLKAASGFIAHTHADSAKDITWETQEALSTRTQAHVGLNRRRKGAESGVLYAREVISEQQAAKRDVEGDDSDGKKELRPTVMQADITASKKDMNVFQQVLAKQATLRIGTARSRGLGKCTVKQFAKRPSRPPLSGRIDAFNEAWRASCEHYGHSPSADSTLISLTLDTPTLFVDAFLRPNLAPEGQDLLQEAYSHEVEHAEALRSLKAVHQIARPATVQGWNGLARFPHAAMQGLQAGSILVFEAPEVTDELRAALSHLEAQGTGLQRHFGMGRIRVCDPIHAHVHEHTQQ